MKNYNLRSVIKGDQKIASISAASIIAKVSRDKMIIKLGKKFKGYYWDKNYGYGTRQHLRAIKNNDKFSGCTVHHVTSKLDTGVTPNDVGIVSRKTAENSSKPSKIAPVFFF